MNKLETEGYAELYDLERLEFLKTRRFKLECKDILTPLEVKELKTLNEEIDLIRRSYNYGED